MNTIQKIRSIKDIKSRDKADKAYDKAHKIKPGSKQDKKLDKKTGVYNYEYGNNKKGYTVGKKEY